jgi:hypothetical protein
MSDDINLQDLEKAERELEKELRHDAQASPICPACGCPTTSRIRSMATIGIVSVACAQFIFFVCFRVYYAIIGWCLLLPACLFALYGSIYLPDYCCRKCGQIFKTKPKRFFT